MKEIFLVTALAFGLTLPAAASAATRLPSRVELRQIIQADHIRDASQDGRLSEDKVAALLREQEELEGRLTRFRADGFFSERELQVLDFLQDALSRHIDAALAPETDAAATERTAEATPPSKKSRRSRRR